MRRLHEGGESKMSFIFLFENGIESHNTFLITVDIYIFNMNIICKK